MIPRPRTQKLGFPVALATALAACGGSSTDPWVDVVTETTGTEFVLQDRSVTVPFSVTNLSNGATYYVLIGLGGPCVTLDRLAGAVWHEQGAANCHLAVGGMTELEPGERIDGGVRVRDAGMYRLRLGVSEEVFPSELQWRETSNVFVVR